MRVRRHLMTHGVCFVTIRVTKSGEVVGAPVVSVRGLVEDEDESMEKQLIGRVEKAVRREVKTFEEHEGDEDDAMKALESRLQGVVLQAVQNLLSKNPAVQVHVVPAD